MTYEPQEVKEKRSESSGVGPAGRITEAQRYIPARSQPSFVLSWEPPIIHTVLAAPSFFCSFTLLIISLMLFFQLAREAEPELLFVIATSAWWAHLSAAACSVFGLAIFHKCSRNNFSPNCADNRTNKGEPWPLWRGEELKFVNIVRLNTWKRTLWVVKLDFTALEKVHTWSINTQAVTVSPRQRNGCALIKDKSTWLNDKKVVSPNCC